MKAAKVQASATDLQDPASGAWASVEAEEVSLQPTPESYQPNQYIRNAWADRSHGVVGSVSAKAAHNGELLAFRLEWEDTAHPEAEFPDAAGVVFPANGQADLGTFGSADAPLNMWFWRSDIVDFGEDVIAKGIGDLATRQDGSVTAKASFDGAKWSLALTRSLAAAGEAGTGFAEGAGQKVSFLVWEGKNEERAGIGSYAGDWIDLELES